MTNHSSHTRRAAIIAFVSQTGNVMKSTLCAAVGVQLNGAGLTTIAVDLDPEHRALGASLSSWAHDRRSQQPLRDPLDVIDADTAKEALAIALAADADIVLIDCPSRASEATTHIVNAADFVILPIVPGKKDAVLTMVTIGRLLQAGVRHDRLAVILTRTASKPEAADMAHWLRAAQIGDHTITVIDAAIPERIGYRTAVAKGLAITEASHPELRKPAVAAVEAIIDAYLTATGLADTPAPIAIPA